MPPESTPRTSNEVLAAKLEGLSNDMAEVNATLKELNANIQKLINAQTNSDVRLVTLETWRLGIDVALSASKEDRQQLWLKIERMESQLSIVKWVGGLLGGGLITWFMGNLLGLIK